MSIISILTAAGKAVSNGVAAFASHALPQFGAVTDLQTLADELNKPSQAIQGLGDKARSLTHGAYDFVNDQIPGPLVDLGVKMTPGGSQVIPAPTPAPPPPSPRADLANVMSQIGVRNPMGGLGGGAPPPIPAPLPQFIDTRDPGYLYDSSTQMARKFPQIDYESGLTPRQTSRLIEAALDEDASPEEQGVLDLRSQNFRDYA